MASNSSKKTAASNVEILKKLHYLSLGIIVFTLVIIYVLKRPSHWLVYLLFQAPLIGCEYILESSGRPKYQYDVVGGYQKLIKSGGDLNQTGLTEYLFDVIYFSWILDILVVIFGTTKIFFLWLVIPTFVIYKFSGFILPFIIPNKSNSQKPEAQSQEKSKRQQKLEKNPRKVRVR